jgi:hypothetical protein
MFVCVCVPVSDVLCAYVAWLWRGCGVVVSMCARASVMGPPWLADGERVVCSGCPCCRLPHQLRSDDWLRASRRQCPLPFSRTTCLLPCRPQDDWTGADGWTGANGRPSVPPASHHPLPRPRHHRAHAPCSAVACWQPVIHSSAVARDRCTNTMKWAMRRGGAALRCAAGAVMGPRWLTLSMTLVSVHVGASGDLSEVPPPWYSWNCVAWGGWWVVGGGLCPTSFLSGIATPHTLAQLLP